MLPATRLDVLCAKHKSSPGTFVSMIVPNPPPARPPLAAKLSPFAAVVEPETAAVPVPHVVPVPSVKDTISAAPATRATAQMRMYVPAMPETSLVDAVCEIATLPLPASRRHLSHAGKL